jgi:hypothetical protein
LEQRKEHLYKVFGQLSKFNLNINVHKSVFGQNKVRFIGVDITMDANSGKSKNSSRIWSTKGHQGAMAIFGYVFYLQHQKT